MIELAHQAIALLRDPGAIIAWGGYPALATIVFLETGLLAFFLPGDSLLVVAGFYAAKGDLDILALNALLGPIAILGDACGYQLGKRLGASVYSRPNSRFFRPDHLLAANAFYARHGGKAIILARFAPLVRTFMPVVAGVAGMAYRQFAAYNVVGGFGWVGSMTLTGYFLGTRFPVLIEHMELVIVSVIVLSLLPGLIEIARARLGSAKGAPR